MENDSIPSVIELFVVSRPLGRHRYQKTSTKKGSLCFQYGESSGLLSEVLREITPIDTPAEVPSAQKKAPGFRKLGKLKEALYEVEKNKEEDDNSIATLINKDGFYDVVLPFDHGQEVVNEKKGNIKLVAILIAAITVVGITMVGLIWSMFS